MCDKCQTLMISLADLLKCKPVCYARYDPFEIFCYVLDGHEDSINNFKVSEAS